MIIQFQLEYLILVLAVWSFVAALFAILIYPYGKLTHKIAILTTAIIIGPLLPILVLAVTPKLFSDLWINHCSKAG